MTIDLGKIKFVVCPIKNKNYKEEIKIVKTEKIIDYGKIKIDKKMEQFKKHKLPVLFGLGAIILATLIVSVGLFKMLFILICAIFGIGIGFYLQQKGLFK